MHEEPAESLEGLSVGVEPVVDEGPFLVREHDARVLEDLHVMGDGWARKARLLGDIDDAHSRARPHDHDGEQLLARLVAESGKHLLARRELPAQFDGFFLSSWGPLARRQRRGSSAQTIGQNRYDITALGFQHL